MTKTASD